MTFSPGLRQVFMRFVSDAFFRTKIAAIFTHKDIHHQPINKWFYLLSHWRRMLWQKMGLQFFLPWVGRWERTTIDLSFMNYVHKIYRYASDMDAKPCIACCGKQTWPQYSKSLKGLHLRRNNLAILILKPKSRNCIYNRA